MLRLQIAAVILVSALLAFAAEENPFYVEEGTIVEESRIWKMKLLNHNPPSPIDSRNPELMHASVIIESLDTRVIHIKIANDSGVRWEAPLYNPNPGQDYKPGLMNDMGFSFEKDPFTFTILNPKNKERILSTQLNLGGSMKYYDKLIELGLWYPSRRIFGYGERTTPDLELCHARNHCKYTIFNADALNPLDTGEPPGANQTYGTHPFYMIHLADGTFMGSFFLNANAQEIEIKKLANGEHINLYHRTIGGIIELYVFYPENADTIMKKYHDLIGRPYIPPYWSLGFHQCRWGWPTLDKVKDVVAKFEQYDIPLEVVWADIDYMLNYTDFTIDPVRYKGLSTFVDDLHKKQMRWVPIIDAGLNYSKSDKYIIEGEKNNALIKSALHKGESFIGRVWPGYTAYVDFMAPYADTLWHMGLGDLELQVKYDGIWLDMNEASNFCDGECFKSNETYTGSDPHDPTEFDDLPYIPGGRPLNVKAIDMAAYHYSTTPDEERLFKEFNLHNIWGILEGRSTHNYILSRGRRPFILTRASYAGSGMHVSVWGGDNYSTWEYMRYSIITTINFQMFGMPLVGADICGFIGNTTEELCARWTQMGAFYPFSRNHNTIDGNDQEPYVFGENVARTSRNAIRQKYSLLQFYYTKLYEVSLYGGSMYKPLFFEYPLDEFAYGARNNTFMIGDSLLVAPVLYQGLKQLLVYLPNANWYDLRTREVAALHDPQESHGPIKILDPSYEYVNVFIKGGSIIPFQDAMAARVRRTETLRILPMEIIIAPDHTGRASGSLIVDDGDSVKPVENKVYRNYAFEFIKDKKQLEVKLLNDYSKQFNFEKFWKLTILNAKDMKDDEKACIYDKLGFVAEVRGIYNSQKETMTYYLANSRLYWKDFSKMTFGKACASGESY